MSATQIILALIAAGVVLFAVMLCQSVLPLTIQLHLSGVPVSMGTLLRWR